MFALFDSIDRSALDRLAERDLEKIALAGRSLGKHQIHDLLLDGPYDLVQRVPVEALSPTFGDSHRAFAEFVNQPAEKIAIALADLPNEEYESLVRKAFLAPPFSQRHPFGRGAAASSQDLGFDVGMPQVRLAVDRRGGKRWNTPRGCVGTLRSRRRRAHTCYNRTVPGSGNRTTTKNGA